MTPANEVYNRASWLLRMNRKTIRYYVSKKILPPATRVGRLSYYNNPEKMIFLLGVIRDMQKVGVKIEAIQKALTEVKDE